MDEYCDEFGDQIDIAIIGSGFGGLGAAIQLRRKGFTDFLIFEKADDMGGTWRDNTYPGCACDVTSNLYSFSFALNPGWSETFSGYKEIWEYLTGCADRFGLRPYLRLGHEIQEAAWDEYEKKWLLTTNRGIFKARVLIAATGPLSQPSVPDIPGLKSFTGKVFHSAQWDHDYDLSGRDVAVIGTGASAVQFVPQIQPKVKRLKLFQRTPGWIVPHVTRKRGRAENWLYQHIPGLARLNRTLLYWGYESMGVGFMHPRINRVAQRVAERNLRRQVPDPHLRAQLMPGYTLGCKRVLRSNAFWPVVAEPNVDLITSGIKEIRAGGLVTADGTEHPVDTIILGTGFHVTDSPVMQRIRGRDQIRLSEAWTPTMRAYLGTTVSGFPNLFFLLGPNTGLGHTSVVIMIESQLKQVIKTLEHMRRNGMATMEPTAEAQRRDNAQVDRKMDGTVWMAGGCRSWYLDSTGRNSTLWPGFATTFRLRLRHFRPADYTFQKEDSRELAKR
ncbi:MAG TPA: NAD(P)/FAD-dependent oxidoreductase [Candidatus Limnocylindrales bacterium]|nr:NAD(P)/FAD-dependent oxidoreductase [Candidatus Limnocylindrales bacterium]